MDDRTFSDLPLAVLPDCVFRTDLDLNLQAVSPAATAMFGIPAAALVGASLGDLVSPDDLVRLQDLVRQALGLPDRTTSQLLQTRIRHAAGHLVPVEVHCRLVLGADGAPAGIVGIARDLTRRLREQEAAVAREQARLQQHKHEALARLATVVAGDLAELLAGVESCPDVRDRPDLASLRARASERLVQLRTVAGHLDHRAEDLDVDAVVAGIVADLRREQPAGLTLVHQPGGGGAVAPVDRGLLARALAALVANARDAMPEQGHVTVRTLGREAAPDGAPAAGSSALPQASTSALVEIAVQDQGPGLAPAAAERAGEPFFSTRRGAAGLGLTLVRAVAAAHGGHVEIASDPDRGTTVTLVLPARFAASAAQPAAPAVGGTTALVVDDDPEVLRYVTRVLRAAGLRVTACGDGVEALAHLAGGEAVDLVVLDWALPGLDGRRVREQVLRRQPRIPLLVISGHTREEYTPLGGVDTDTPWLVKPFTPGELRAAVGHLLRQRAAGSGS